MHVCVHLGVHASVSDSVCVYLKGSSHVHACVCMNVFAKSFHINIQFSVTGK